MTMPVTDQSSSAVSPVAPVFLNFRSEVVRPVRFAVVHWDGPGDTLYAFEDQIAFERQRATAERHFVHVHRLSAEEAANWMPPAARPSSMSFRSPAPQPWAI
jgi:hypothetical protein